MPYFYGDGVGFVVSNNAGSLVGWFEFPQADQPELVVYDAALGEEIARLTRLREAGRLSTTERRRLDELLEGEAKAETARAERIRAFLAGRGNAAPSPREGEVRAEGIERRSRRIGKETALAYYLLGDAHLRILIVAGGTTQEVRIPLDGRELGREIRAQEVEVLQRRENLFARCLRDHVYSVSSPEAPLAHHTRGADQYHSDTRPFDTNRRSL